MSIKSELIYRFLLVLAIMFIVGKLLGPAIFSLLWEKFFGQKKKPNVDLDVLIEQKKKLMRGDTPEKQIIPRPEKKSSVVGTVERYKLHFQELSENPDRDPEQFADVKKTMSLLDNLQWGEGKEYEHLKKKINEKSEVDIDQLAVSKALKLLIKRDTLISRKTEALPSYNEILKVLELKILLDILVSESKAGGGKLINKLAKKSFSTPESIIKAFTYIILTNDKYDKTKAHETVLNEQMNIPSMDEERLEIVLLKMLKSDDNKFFLSRNDLMKELMDEVEFFASLAPLPHLEGQKDLEGAYNVLGMSPEKSIDEIKKRYKKLANQKHPDKLSSKGIPPEFESIATENFATIQMAYDIILKNRK